MLSKACQYAIKCLIYLAKHQNESKIPLMTISEGLDSPPAFTSKILQQLVAAEFITSTKGGNGGFEIDAYLLDHITVGQIISIIDGDALGKGCLLGLSECSAINPCPLHYKYVEIKDKLNQSLFKITLNELLKKNKSDMILKD